MKTALELYGERAERYSAFTACDYDPMLYEFGNVLVIVEDDDYQGDSRILYEKDGKYGYLQFGWGSCSGCDALQACSTTSEAQELMDELYQSINWFDSPGSCLEWFKEHDWEGDYSAHSAEQKTFVDVVIKTLSEIA